MKESNVFISKICGLCYGSNNAINKTRELLNSNNNVVLYKEILHNTNVIKELEAKGAKTKDHLKEIHENDYVVVRAHGEPASTFKNNTICLKCFFSIIVIINIRK